MQFSFLLCCCVNLHLQLLSIFDCWTVFYLILFKYIVSIFQSVFFFVHKDFIYFYFEMFHLFSYSYFKSPPLFNLFVRCCLHSLDGSIKYSKSLKRKREKLWSVKYDYKQEKNNDLIAVISFALLMSLPHNVSPDDERFYFFYFFYFLCTRHLYSSSLWLQQKRSSGERQQLYNCFKHGITTLYPLKQAAASPRSPVDKQSPPPNLSNTFCFVCLFWILTLRRLQIFFCP